MFALFKAVSLGDFNSKNAELRKGKSTGRIEVDLHKIITVTCVTYVQKDLDLIFNQAVIDEIYFFH